MGTPNCGACIVLPTICSVPQVFYNVLIHAGMVLYSASHQDGIHGGARGKFQDGDHLAYLGLTGHLNRSGTIFAGPNLYRNTAKGGHERGNDLVTFSPRLAEDGSVLLLMLPSYDSVIYKIFCCYAFLGQI